MEDKKDAIFKNKTTDSAAINGLGKPIQGTEASPRRKYDSDGLMGRPSCDPGDSGYLRFVAQQDYKAMMGSKADIHRAVQDALPHAEISVTASRDHPWIRVRVKTPRWRKLLIFPAWRDRRNATVVVDTIRTMGTTFEVEVV